MRYRYAVCSGLHLGFLGIQLAQLSPRDPRDDVAQRMLYSVSHHMIIKQFSFYWACSCNTVQYNTIQLLLLCHQQLSTTVAKYGTHWRTKLTVPETMSRSRDMVGAHQNLNGPRDLTTPISGMVFRP